MKKILSPMEKLNFPESEELPEGVREIEAEDRMDAKSRILERVNRENKEVRQKKEIMTPTVFGQDLKWPLIVYV